MLAKPISAGFADAVRSPRWIKNVFDDHFIDIRQRTDGLHDLIVDHLQCGTSREGRRDDYTSRATMNLDPLDDTKINDADRHLGIVNRRQQRSNAGLEGLVG